VFSSARDGVHIFSPDGELIGKIPLPECCANLAFGGKDGRELYMTASKSLYRIRLKTTGAVVKVEP
jgi:gluconolactonase